MENGGDGAGEVQRVDRVDWIGQAHCGARRRGCTVRGNRRREGKLEMSLNGENLSSCSFCLHPTPFPVPAPSPTRSPRPAASPGAFFRHITPILRPPPRTELHLRTPRPRSRPPHRSSRLGLRLAEIIAWSVSRPCPVPARLVRASRSRRVRLGLVPVHARRRRTRLEITLSALPC